MFRTKSNAEIGKYLEDLIRKSEYRKDRPFCKAYLALRDGDPDPASEDIQKMQNRFSQIKQGKKGIQIEDLPIFSELLRVSVDDILSAGTALVPVQNRITNYSVAFSKDPAEWQAYIEREDKLILNPDEYDKTVIDYALEAGNYPFLKYLTDKGYIWFVGNDKNRFYGNCFGAGTSIPKREAQFRSDLDFRLQTQDDLRFKMIDLAVRNKDFDMLDELHAREIPLLYTLGPTGNQITPETLLPTPNVEQMIESIASSENTVLAYFFDEFEISTGYDAFRNTYVFPYSGRVLDALIKANRVNESKRFLEKAIEHNKKVWKNLQSLTDKCKARCKEYYERSYGPDYEKAAAFRQEVWGGYSFYPETGFVTYFTLPYVNVTMTYLVMNVINVTETTKNEEVQFLVDELHKNYDSFTKLLEKKEA